MLQVDPMLEFENWSISGTKSGVFRYIYKDLVVFIPRMDSFIPYKRGPFIHPFSLFVIKMRLNFCKISKFPLQLNELKDPPKFYFKIDPLQ
jgi:hypothetical protein